MTCTCWVSWLLCVEVPDLWFPGYMVAKLLFASCSAGSLVRTADPSLPKWLAHASLPSSEVLTFAVLSRQLVHTGGRVQGLHMAGCRLSLCSCRRLAYVVDPAQCAVMLWTSACTRVWTCFMCVSGGLPQLWRTLGTVLALRQAAGSRAAPGSPPAAPGPRHDTVRQCDASLAFCLLYIGLIP